MDDTETQVLTVSILTATIKELLEAGFAQVWVAGEVTNVSRPSSGHIYYSLVDGQATLKCVTYRGDAGRLPFELKNGMQVVARGRISVYPPSGQYQLVANVLQPQGMGRQELLLRQLKEKLARLGYFAAERKRPLPSYPARIGIVTSRSGAAIRDMLEVFRTRWPLVDVLLFPVRVQGDGSAREIAEGIRRANEFSETIEPIDLLIVGRGGGSAEDLAAFDEEGVASAIFESALPVVSAVGHEIDVSIADMVADVRALTPTHAANLAVPSREELREALVEMRRRLADLLRGRAENARLRLQGIARHPAFRSPLDGIRERERRLDDLGEKLRRRIDDRNAKLRTAFAALAGRLESLSPLKVLARGYSLTEREADGSLAKASQLQPGDRIRTRLADGRVTSRIEEVFPNP